MGLGSASGPALVQAQPSAVSSLPEEGTELRRGERREVWREPSTPTLPTQHLPKHREACGVHQRGCCPALCPRRLGARCPTGSQRKPQIWPHFPEASLLLETSFCPNPSPAFIPARRLGFAHGAWVCPQLLFVSRGRG